MAFNKEDKMVLIPVEPKCSNFRIVLEDKAICVYGFDGETKNVFTGDFEEVFLTLAENSRSNTNLYELAGIATTEDGTRFLVLIVVSEKD